jgi:FtsH-binding integral membrane protein
MNNSTRRPLRSHNARSLARDWLVAGAAATLLSGIPSTLYSMLTGADVLAPTRAAGRMLVPAGASELQLFVAAALVHTAISFFWAALLILMLPRKHVTLWSVIAAALIGVLDLCIIAPLFFPEVAALAFWPQMADHVMWGASFGLALAHRWRART